MGGGGVAQKIRPMCAHAHLEHEERSPLRAGSRALWVFDAISCYLSLSFKHSDTKWGNNIVDQI